MNKQTKTIAYSIMILSLIMCTIIGVFRVNKENEYKQIQIAIRYTDVLNIAQQTQRSIDDVLKELKEVGANTLFVRENTVLPSSRGELSNYKEQGEVTVFEGYLLNAFYKQIPNVKPQFNYVVTEDADISESIYTNLALKNVPVKRMQYENMYLIEMGDFSNALSTIGVGFNDNDLKIAATLGYTISPQIKNWVEPSEESVQYLIEDLKEIPNLGPIYFADSEVPAFKSKLMIDFMKEEQLGFVEFFSNKQKGFNALAKAASENGKDFNVIRLHTATDEEMKSYSPQEVLDRYTLALEERNLRVFLFKMNNTMNMTKDIHDLKINIQNFKDKAIEKGYSMTRTIPNYSLPAMSYLAALFAGIAAIIMFTLLLDRIGITKAGYILAVIGFIGYAALLKVAPNLAVKLMALFGAIVFPTYAVVQGIEYCPRNIKETVIAFLKICLISFGGALTIVGTLSRTNFGLAIDVFAGVKAAHIIPILLVLIWIVYEKYGLSKQYITDKLTMKVSYLAVVVIGIVAVALLVYTSRTGNNGGVSELELYFRQCLDNILGVRPRTKEFLIGYPILILLLRYGYKEMYFPFLVFATIGPISFVNTYAHIHTPLLVSLTRSAYGIIIGLIIGLVCIYVLKLAKQVVDKWTA